MILGLSAFAVASLYGYDLAVSQIGGSLLGEEDFGGRGTRAGLRSPWFPPGLIRFFA